MPVDKFGRMSDAKTRDTGVSLTYINNNYVRSDGGTPVSGSINMNGNTLYNVADPVNPQDVATKKYADKRTHIIAAHASYHGDLIKSDYQFTFGGSSVKSYQEHDVFNGFLMPHSGYIKRFVLKDTGFKFSSSRYTNLVDLIRSLGSDLIPIFTLVLIKPTNEVVDLGTLNMQLKFIQQEPLTYYSFNSNLVGGLEEYKINVGDILNIRSGINTIGQKEFFRFSNSGVGGRYSIDDFDYQFYTYLATIFIELDPL